MYTMLRFSLPKGREKQSDLSKLATFFHPRIKNFYDYSDKHSTVIKGFYEH